MIDALIAGKLFNAPQQRTGRTGSTFVTCKVRVPNGEGATFASVIAFDPGAQAALLALGPGDAVALAGEVRLGVWTDKTGQPVPSMDVTVSKVLTQYGITKRRAASQQPAARQPARLERGHHDDQLDDGQPLEF